MFNPISVKNLTRVHNLYLHHLVSHVPYHRRYISLFSESSSDLTDSMSHNASALPGPPSKPEVTDVTKSSVSLSWEPEPEESFLVASYVIEAFGYVWAHQPPGCTTDPKLSEQRQMWAL